MGLLKRAILYATDPHRSRVGKAPPKAVSFALLHTTRGYKMLLSDAVAGYLLFKTTRASPRTIETDSILLSQFKRYIGSTDVRDITPQDVRDYISHHADRGLSPFTLRRHLAVVSAMYTWLTSPDVGIADTDPTNQVSNPKLPDVKPKALERDAIEALVDATRQSHNPRRDKAIVLFLLDTGARASELCGVRISDVGFETGKVLLQNTKGSKERFVYLGQRARSALWLYVADERPDPAQVGCDRVFLTQDGYPMTRHTLRSLIVRTGQRAGVQGATTHRFRHTAAISYLRSGAVSLAHLQHLLGHSDISTTRNYTLSLRDEDVQDVVQSVAPSDNWRL
jgi:integrase/recombinase XerD